MGKTELYNVVAVDLKTKAERIMAEGKSKADAEAIVEMAVMRRGCEVEFFRAVRAAKGE